MCDITNNDLRFSLPCDGDVQNSSTLSGNVKINKEKCLEDEPRSTNKDSCDQGIQHPRFCIPEEDLHQEPRNGKHFKDYERELAAHLLVVGLILTDACSRLWRGKRAGKTRGKKKSRPRSLCASENNSSCTHVNSKCICLTEIHRFIFTLNRK